MALTLDELISGARTAKRQHRDVQITLDQAVADQIEALDLRILQLEQEEMDVSVRADAELAEAKRDARLGDPRGDEIRTARDARIAEILQQIEAASEEREHVTDGTLITLRFERIPGQAWAEISARHPARADVTIDRVYGYNYHETAKEAAQYRNPADVPEPGRPYAHRLVDAEEDGAEPTLEEISREQWDGILSVISGHEFERIASGVWDLNDYGPQQRIAAAGKASRAGSVSRSS